MKRRVLITGSMGFVGGRLAQHLHQAGYQVCLGSRLVQSPPKWLPEAQVVKMVWSDSNALSTVCAGIDLIIHSAGMNAHDCLANPSEALTFNGVATARLLDEGSRVGVKRFIYLSTAHVYGSPLGGVITENTCPASLHPYATTHRAGEDMVRAAHQRGEIEGVVVRLSNTYGAPVHKDVNCWMLLVNDLCRQAVTSHGLVLRSSGLERRDFIPLSDACSAIKHLLEQPAQDLGNGLFNVGGEWSPTIWEIACFIQHRCKIILGFEPKITRTPPQAENRDSELDYRIDAMRKMGYQPSMSPASEIDQLLNFCQVSYS